MLDRELESASELARAAGDILLEIYATDFGVDWKGKSDPVTAADRRANAFLADALHARFPGDGVVAEESADHGDALSRERCWFVDPLDGTKEFIAKNGEFSVMIGLAVVGRAVLGVVYQPVTDKLYRGVVGAGAVLEHGGNARALRCSDRAEPSTLRLVVSRSHRSRSTDAVVSRLGIRDESVSGSVGLKIGHIAEDRADLYVHMSGRSSKWDACAPEAILRAAGGRFSDLFGAEIDYRHADMANARGLLACNAAAYAAVLPVVRAVASEAGPER
jgi:3'(2'), 5'-bisphosphate nucleotidase